MRHLPAQLARFVLRALAIALLFLGMVLLSLVAHQNHPALRMAASSALEDLLNSTLQGKLELAPLDHISLGYVHCPRVRVWDPQGREVLALDGLGADLDLWPNVRRWLRGGDVRIAVPHVRGNRATVWLFPDSDAVPSLAAAFTPRPTPPKPAGAGSSGKFTVYLPELEVGRISVARTAADYLDLSPTLSRVHAKLLVSPLGVNLAISEYWATLPTPLGEPLTGFGSLGILVPGPVTGSFAGFIAGTELQTNVKLHEEELTASLHVPSLAPESGRRLLPGWPVTESLAMHAEAVGPLDALRTTAEVQTGNSSVVAAARVNLTDGIALEGDVVAEDINLAIATNAPPTAISGITHVRLRTAGTTKLQLAGRTLATTIGEMPLPASRFALDYMNGELEGTLHLEEAASPLVADVRLHSTRQYSAEASIPHLDLGSHPRLPRVAEGATSLRLGIHSDAGAIRAWTRGDIVGFAIGPLTTDAASFDVQANGSLSDLSALTYSGTVNAHNARTPWVAFQDAALQFDGDLSRAAVTLDASDPDGRTVTLSGNVDRALRLTSGNVHARKNDVAISAKLVEISPGESRYQIDAVEVTGAGSPLRGWVRYEPDLVAARIESDGLHIEQALAALGLKNPGVLGDLSIDADIELGERRSQGRVVADLKGLSYSHWGRAKVHFETQLNGDHVSSQLWGSDETTGVAFGLDYAGQIGGSPLAAASWMAATGSLDMAINNVDLATLEVLGVMPKAGVSGLVGFRARLERPEPTGWPSAFFEIGGQALGATLEESGRSLTNTNLYLSGLFSPDTHRTYGGGSLRGLDGDIVTAAYSITLDPSAVVDAFPHALRVLRSAPIDVTLTLPQRTLASVPFVEAAEMPEGQVTGEMRVAGTIDSPKTTLHLSASELAPHGEHPSRMPLSVNLQGEYDVNEGTASAQLLANTQGRRVVDGTLEATVPRGSIPTSLASVRGQIRAELDSVPLGLIPQLAETKLSGFASGPVTLRIDEKSSLRASLQLSRIASGQAPLGSGTVELKGSSSGVTGMIELRQEDQHVRIDLEAKTKNPKAQLQESNISVAEARVSIKHLRAAVFGPALDGVADRLDGTVDAVGGIRLENGQDGFSGSGYGQATWINGVTFIPLLGLELRDIEATLEAAPSKSGTALVLTNLRARARSDAKNFHGNARLSLDGHSLESGSANLSFDAVPLTLEGVSLGRATGLTRVTMQRQQGWPLEDTRHGEDFLDVEVAMTDWRFRAADTASRDLIDIDERPDIVVRQLAEPPKSGRTIPIRVRVRLADRVRVAFGQIDLPLGGEVLMTRGEHDVTTGTIQLLPGGRIPIFGHRFDVQGGKIVLNPQEPDNPRLYVTLVGYTADGEVNVAVLGTLKEPITTPAPDQLQSLLGSATGTALSGGLQALGVDRLLGDSLGRLQLRVDAAESTGTDPLYAASFPLTDTLWFEGTYQKSQDVNQASQDVFAGTLDYRFRKNWSLKTEIRNTGASVDVQWQHRY